MKNSVDENDYQEVVMLETGVWGNRIPVEARPLLAEALGIMTQKIAGNI